jgi:hypothetical protein
MDCGWTPSADSYAPVSTIRNGPVNAIFAGISRAFGFQPAAGMLKFLIQTPINNQELNNRKDKS